VQEEGNEADKTHDEGVVEKLADAKRG